MNYFCSSPVPSFYRSLFLGAITVSIWGHLNSAFAQEAAQSTVKVEAGVVELSASRVYVHAFKTGLGHEHAVEGKIKSGTILLKGDAPSGDAPFGEVVFDMQSFDADGPRARKYVGLSGTTDSATRKQVNENLLGKDVLDVKRFPTAKFVVKRVENVSAESTSSESRVKLEGEFTLHGRTRPITVDAVKDMVNGWQHLRGEFKIRQTDFGIKPYTKAFGAVGVADELVIFGDLYVAP